MYEKREKMDKEDKKKDERRKEGGRAEGRIVRWYRWLWEERCFDG